MTRSSRSRKNLKNNRKRLIKNNLTKTITTTVIATGVCAPFSLTNVYAEEIKSVDKQIEAKKIDEKYPETGIVGWGLENKNGKVIEGHGSEAKKTDKKYPETGITGWGLEDENGKVIEGYGSEAKKVDKKYPETGITGWGLEDENGKVIEGHGSEAKKTDKSSEQVKVNTESGKDKIETKNESNDEYLLKNFDLKKLQEIKDKLDKYKDKLKENGIRKNSYIDIYINLFKENPNCSNFEDLIKKPNVDKENYISHLKLFNEVYNKLNEIEKKTEIKQETGKELEELRSRAKKAIDIYYKEATDAIGKYGKSEEYGEYDLAHDFGAIDARVKSADSKDKLDANVSIADCVRKECIVSSLESFLSKRMREIEAEANLVNDQKIREEKADKDLLHEMRELSSKLIELKKLRQKLRSVNGENETFIAKNNYEGIKKNMIDVESKYRSMYVEDYADMFESFYKKLKDINNLANEKSSIEKEREEIMKNIRDSKNEQTLVDILKKPIPGNIDEIDKKYMESIVLGTTSDGLESQKNKLLDLLSKERGNLKWEGIKEEGKKPEIPEIKNPDQGKKPEVPEIKNPDQGKKPETNDPVKLYKKQEIKDNLNPKTGDSGILGFAALGFSGLLGLVLNKIKSRRK